MLANEIEQAQRLVRTDAYQMSVGEIVTMYKDGDLIINPDFQRLFRWEAGQKSKLIESILLGIPLPPIFVFERPDSKWELIDGLQRLSTILEFMGILIGPDGQPAPPSYLEATKYLPSLGNLVWEKSDTVIGLTIEEQNPLGKNYQLAIRRSRLGIEILKRPSDNNTKYDLFQRLNAAGTPANAQELRNCIIIMVNADYYRFLQYLSQYQAFVEVVDVTEDQIERQRLLEFVSRFLVHVYVAYDGKLDVEEYIDEGIKNLAEAGDAGEPGWRFEYTFDLLEKVYGRNALRRLSVAGHSGRTTLAAFECIAVGIGKNVPEIAKLENPEEFVQNKIQEFWKMPDISRFFAAGVRGTTRIQKTITFGQGWFRP